MPLLSALLSIDHHHAIIAEIDNPNGKDVAEGWIDKSVPVYLSPDDTFDIAEEWAKPVSPAYQPPFPITGTLTKVIVQALLPKKVVSACFYAA